MAVLEIAYIVGSIGMQLVNNLANSKQKKEQQERMREYKKAVLEQDMQRAREIQREAAECAKQLEAEAHRIRLEEIESEKDQFLAEWAKQLNIQYWPINVLPFVMMGESFGSMFGGGAKTVAIHCIFTPSNYAKFNQLFYDDIDQGLEEKINTDWSINSDHPVIYYGGCWKERGPYGIPKDIDLPDIDRLEQEIGKLPTLVITPYFDPHLHFRIRHWGMGERTFGKLIPPTDLFSYSYVKGQFPDPKKVDEEAFKKFCDTTVEEIVTFLESLIGFVADRYFWSLYGSTPKLPSMQLPETSNEEYRSHMLRLNNSYCDTLTSQIKEEQSIVDKDVQFISLYDVLIDFICLQPIPSNDTLTVEFDKKNHITSCYWKQHFVMKDSIRFYKKYNVRSDALLVPLDLREVIQSYGGRFSLPSDKVHALIDDIFTDCDTNVFFCVLSLNSIIQFCKGKSSDIKEVRLSIRDAIPQRQLNCAIKCENLMFCQVVGEDDDIYEYILYYDSFSKELEDMFSNANEVILT